jgi:hypothetical protein
MIEKLKKLMKLKSENKSTAALEVISGLSAVDVAKKNLLLLERTSEI